MPKTGRKNTVRVPKTSDPFLNDLPSNSYETFKFWFLTLTGIAIARFVLFIVVLLIGGGIGCLASIGAPKGLDVPWPRWRTLVASPISFCARILLFCIGFHWITIDDRQKKKGQVVVIAPHTGLMDSFFITWYFLPSPISKSTVRDIPVFGSLCIALQTIFVDRESSHDGPYSRKKVLETMILRSKDSRFPRMCIFPEGTTNNGKLIMQFKKGAFAPGEPVTPVLLTYPNDHYNCACAGRNGTDMSMVRCLWQFHNRMHATILDAYEPSEEEKADPELFARNVRDYMAREMDLPTSEHTYPDLFLQMEGTKMHGEYYFNQDFEVGALTEMFGLKLDQCKLLLRRFAEVDKDKDGSISRPEFVEMFHLQTSPPPYIDRLMSFFDTEDAGVLHFRQFVQGVALVSEVASVEQRVPLAFVMADRGCKEAVDADDMRAICEAGKALAPQEFPFDEKAFMKFDKDRDGVLNYAEFEEYVKANNGALKPVVAIAKDRVGVCFETLNITIAEHEGNQV